MARRRNIKGLETALGYKFKRKALLERALTHASVRTDQSKSEDNERLEFLGDRVLGLAIAELLCELEPEANEGALARRFNRLVRKEACARIGRVLELGPLLTMSVAEDENGGRDKSTILADAAEAVLAAIFLDGGFTAARDVVRRQWMPLFEMLPATVADAKSLLQEWAQGSGLPLPKYKETKREGPDHAPKFTTEVRIEGYKAATGIGSSKRAAEQAAAMTMLEREGIINKGAVHE
ncbi:MAG: ribonuclease III [Hyphomicrobiaceae bacterium]